MRKTNRISEIDSSPFPHVVVEDFLDEDTLDLVIDALAGLEYSFNESDLFSYWASVKLTDIDHPALNVLREDLGDENWREEVSRAFKVSKLSKIDMAAYVYGLGDFLLPHDDQVENRIIAYSLHLTPDLEEEDGGSLDLFEDNKIKILVDKKSLLYLLGTTLDYSGGLNGKGFVFNNPNAERTCGCGESFSM